VDNADGTITYIARDLSKEYRTCGANNYFYHNNTIEFVMNGDCLIRLR